MDIRNNLYFIVYYWQEQFARTQPPRCVVLHLSSSVSPILEYHVTVVEATPSVQVGPRKCVTFDPPPESGINNVKRCPKFEFTDIILTDLNGGKDWELSRTTIQLYC